MKRSESSDVKEENRISSGRSSKAQRTEVWGNQIQLTKQEILKLREEKNKLNEQLGNKDQLVLKGIIDKGEYDKEKASLKAQIAETQKEIQPKEAELKEMTKKFEETAQAMETEESGERQSYEFDVATFFKRVSESSKLAENVSKKVAIRLFDGHTDRFTVEEDSFVEFLHRLHEAKEIDGVLEVGAPILAKQGYPSIMLVRDVVEDHIEDTLKCLDSGVRVIHYGTPGYGKSMTGALVVKKKMGKKLIVIQQGGTWYFVPKDFPRACVVVSMYPETMKTYAIAQAKVSGMKTRPIFYLIDPQSQRTAEVIVFGEIAEQLATVSPNTLLLNDKLRSWEKQHGGAIRKVEPHWENKNMKNCYEKCYKSSFTLHEYKRRLYFWGNNPRNVFNKLDLVETALDPTIMDLRPADVK